MCLALVAKPTSGQVWDQTWSSVFIVSTISQGWRNGSVIKNTCYTGGAVGICKGSRFDSQNPPEGTQPLLTLILEESPLPASSGTAHTEPLQVVHRHTNK